MIHALKASFPTDDDDFLSRRCPRCRSGFKQRVSADGTLNTAACPHCGVRGDRWETAAQEAHLKAIVEHQVIAPAFADFEKSMKKLGSSGSGLTVKVTGGFSGKPAPVPPRERIDELPAETTTPCCRARIRHALGATLRFCPCCAGALAGEAAP